MSETEQLYLPLQTESSHTDNGFYDSLNFIRENANSQYGVGKVFERLKPFTSRIFVDKNRIVVNLSWLAIQVNPLR